MLLCVKQLLIIFVFTSITNGGNDDLKNKNNDVICQKQEDYYNKNTFEKSLVKKFYNSVGKDVKKHMKKKSSKNHKSDGIENCHDSKDYMKFNTFYNKNQQKITHLNCDLIKPILPGVTLNRKCKSIGQYYIQFGVEVYYQFSNYLYELQNPNEKGLISKIWFKGLKKLVNKHNKLKTLKNKKIVESLIIIHIRVFYKKNCNCIITHYNLFYTFYNTNNLENKIEKDHKNIHRCDYFMRINLHQKNLQPL